MRECLRELKGAADNQAERDFLKMVEEDVSYHQDQFDVYTFSLSENRDQLSQWQAYGDGGQGYCIGFDLDGCEIVVPHATSVFLTEVEYLRENQTQRIRDGISEAIQQWEDLPDPPGQADVEYIASRVARQLLLLCSSFKDPSFQEESEFRIVAMVFGAEDGHQGTDFRVSGIHLIPQRYITVADDGRLPVSSVIVGPGHRAGAALEATRKLLRVYGHDATPARSKVPLR